MGNGTQDNDKTISINIPQSMYDWLSNEGKQINRSELFRQAVNEKMNFKKGKVSPTVFLISVMGIVFSIAILGIAITPSPINVYARGLMCILSGILAFATSSTYLKETQKVKGMKE